MSLPDKNKIKVGISSCLLDEKVRYDGGHKLDLNIRDTLGKFFDFVPVCPETECGLGIPREAMHLEGDPSDPRLVTIRTRIDHTECITDWGAKKLDELANLDLCGYIFKSRSPSCGMESVKVYNKNGILTDTGTGIWAAMFMKRFAEMPVEDEGGLKEPEICERFVERVLFYDHEK